MGRIAFLYNTVFVDDYNALAQSLKGNSGYHMLAFATKSDSVNPA